MLLLLDRQLTLSSVSFGLLSCMLQGMCHGWMLPHISPLLAWNLTLPWRCTAGGTPLGKGCCTYFYARATRSRSNSSSCAHLPPRLLRRSSCRKTLLQSIYSKSVSPFVSSHVKPRALTPPSPPASYRQPSWGSRGRMRTSSGLGVLTLLPSRFLTRYGPCLLG